MDSPAQRPRTLILPPAPYAAALLGGWWLDRNLYALHWDWGGLTQPLGGILVGAGLVLLIWTFVTFRRHRTTINPYQAASSLCTGGPFRFSRNPIYVGDGFILAGGAMLMQSGWPLVFAPLVWGMIRYGVIRHEEAHLEARFGEAYRLYKTRVRRWL